MWHVRRGDTRLRGVAPLTDGHAAGTGRGETDASGLHGVDVPVGLARMFLPGVPMGRTNTTGWRGPLVKARPWEVRGLDLVVNRSRVRQDGGLGGVAMPSEHHTGPSYMRGGVVACPKRRHASPGCGHVKDGTAAGTWRGETDASGLHGGDVAVGLARMLLPGVPLCRPDTTRWRGPLVKASRGNSKD